jgi:hypothetical protein
MAPFQNCVRWSRLPTKMAAKLKIEKGGMKFKQISSPLKLLSQSQLAQWFLRRRFLCEFSIGSYVKLSSAVRAILVEGPNSRTHFWKRTIQWLFHQHFVLIEQMFLKLKESLLLWNYWTNLNQTLLKWFLGGPLPNLCPAFQNTAHFWKRTIQWLFHQNFVLIEQMVSDEKIFMRISHRVLC